MAINFDQIFNFANIFVLPFWVLMIFLPRWEWTRKVIGSYIPFVILALLYLFLFVSSVTPENAQALANPKLADIARFLGEEKAAATGWIHFLVMDLFVGWWIYNEGLRSNVFTAHSLLLCFFAGPFGLLSHIITAAVTTKFFPNSLTDLPDNVTPSEP